MHVHILNEKQKSILELLSGLDFMREFYLAGGTALALQYGHRASVDFDFFREEAFSADKILNHLSQKTHLNTRLKQESTLYVLIDEISCSFFKYPYPLLRETISFKKNIALAVIPDLAAMKVSAITVRGTKRDFVDLFFICQRDFSLKKILDLYQKKFAVLNHELYHVFRSLVYFDDAETDVMPKLFDEVSWNDIKEFFNKEVTKLTE